MAQGSCCGGRSYHGQEGLLHTATYKTVHACVQKCASAYPGTHCVAWKGDFDVEAHFGDHGLDQQAHKPP